MQKDIEYSNAVAKVRIGEKYLINKQKLFRLAEQKTVTEVYKLLSENRYEIPERSEGNANEVLLSEQLKTNRFMESLFEEQDKAFIDLILIENDYYNMKTYLKLKLSDEKIDNSLFIHAGTIPVDSLISSLSEEEQGKMNKYMFEAYLKAKKEYLEDKNPQVIDFYLDEALYQNQIELAEDFGCSFISDYLKTQIDLINLKTILRVKRISENPSAFKKALLSGGSLSSETLLKLLIGDHEFFKSTIGKLKLNDQIKKDIISYFDNLNLSDLDKAFDNLLVEKLKKARFIAFGPEPIFVYYKVKEAELRAVRIILNGIENGLSSDKIKERLRDTYV